MEVQWMRKGVITQTKGKPFFPIWVRQRELSQRLPLGHSDAFYKSLYSSISRYDTWAKRKNPGEERGLFSLEFSPDGNLLVAGCDNNSLLMFDPSYQKLIRSVSDAHTDVVTKVKFLDSRIFATGSIDKTISLWDIRNLKSRLRTLVGYSSTNGNLEFSRKNNFLITTGPSDTIYIWDVKNWEQKFDINTFMPHVFGRLRLNPDETKMILSTSNGYLLIIHELDWNRIDQDLKEFELEMFDFASLMQANTTSGWSSSRFVFPKRRRNRVEIVADFPNADGCSHVISALEMHPQGWSVISRSKNEESAVEFTCVHDIQEKKSSERGVTLTPPSSSDSGPELPDAALPLERGARRRRSGSTTDPERARSPTPGPSSAPPDPLELAGLRSNLSSYIIRDLLTPRPNPNISQLNRRVHVHVPRLTHYIQEPHATDWYISSLCVSADGRLVCSPFNRGIRLLAFSPECSEQSVSWCGRIPRPLHELSTHYFYSDNVLSARFSPRHCLLVSGSLNGKLFWYQPIV